MKKPTTMFDFFIRKYSNSSKVNIGLPITNLAIPIPKKCGCSNSRKYSFLNSEKGQCSNPKKYSFPNSR